MQIACIIKIIRRVWFRQRKRANCVVARGNEFQQIELAKRQGRAAQLNHFAQAKIMRIQISKKRLRGECAF